MTKDKIKEVKHNQINIANQYLKALCKPSRLKRGMAILPSYRWGLKEHTSKAFGQRIHLSSYV